jgi:thiol-disulfide isomerase/thioredoxin
MEAPAAFSVLLVLVAASTMLGITWQRRTGRVTQIADAADGRRGAIAGPGSFAGLESLGEFGERATLLQFSTEVCAPCAATRRVLAGIAADVPGVSHIEVDVAQAPDLAARFKITQAPTTFLLDADRSLRARIGGAPRVPALTARLDEILRETRTDA